MANSLGTLTSNIVSGLVLDATLSRLAPLRAITSDFSAETADFNQSIKVRTVTPAAVAAYHTTNGYVAGNATTTDYTVTVDTHKHVSLAFHEQEVSGTRRNLLEEQAMVSGYALADALIDAVSALIIAATFTNTAITETDANTDRDSLLNLRKSLTTAGAPDMNRSVLMSTAAFTYLCADAKIASADYNNHGNIDLVTGVLRNVGGFSAVYECPQLPSTGNMNAVALHRSALLIATRLPKDPGTQASGLMIPGTIEIVQDEATGLALQCRTWYDMQKGFLNQTYTLMYGVAAGVVAHATIQKTA